MCGICGFTWRDETMLGLMVNSLKHRGPDANGTFVDDRVSIGHTRLSIIDLSETGRQPMQSVDGNVVVSYNGEIYNFRDLRRELERLGYRFKGTSDTEVFLYSYIEWGPEAFSKFNGMWAACIYDTRNGSIVLSRDRIGVKPLYFSHDRDRLIFASEIKAMLHHGLPRDINPAAIDLLLSSQFIPSPMSIFRAISKVEPRQYLTYDLGSGRLSKNYYYDIPRYAPIFSRRRVLESGRDLLIDSVRMRLVSDVPVGAFLSGGMDSTTVVAEMKKYVKAEHLNTVSVGFDLPGLDESKYIRLASDEFQTQHHHITFRAEDIEKLVADLFRVYDEPVADPSSFPMYSLCQETRRWMTVALSGDGGDEIFGGYEDRRIVAQFAMIRRVPRLLRNLAHRILVRLNGYDLTALGKLAEALRVSLLDPSEYSAEIGASLVYRPDAFKAWARQRLQELLPLSGGNLVEAVLKFDIYYNRLGDNYAAKVDRISMAHSLEVRSPFLDYRFMEYSSTVPVTWKMTARKTKILMKSLVRGLIPDQIIDREKHGFAGPLGVWVEKNEAVLKNAAKTLFEMGVLDERWLDFFQNRVFGRRHSIYQEYKKRLFFLWQWHKVWGANPHAGRQNSTATQGT